MKGKSKTRESTSNEKQLVARCTACRKNIKTTFDACLHPLLLCLVCRKCHKDYGTGDFSTMDDPELGKGVDEDGYDNFCRWCVDGGELFECSKKPRDDPENCRYVFCKNCIERNCPDDKVLTNKSKDFCWICLACEPDRLKDKRREAQEFIQALNKRELKRPTSRAPSNLIQPPNKQITPAGEHNLKELELKKRLDEFKRVANQCSSEINNKFETIIEMFHTKHIENRAIIQTKIDDIEKPIQEFNQMIQNLRCLYASSMQSSQ